MRWLVVHAAQSMVCRAILAFAILGPIACASCSHRHIVDSTPRPGLVLAEESGEIDTILKSGEKWSKECRIHHPCQGIKPLPKCPRDIEVSTIPPSTTTSDENGISVRVAGRLLLEPPGQTVVGCGAASCCNWAARRASLVDDNGTYIKLPDIGCFGDESRMCCNVIESGHKVVAIGRIWLEGEGTYRRAFFKDSVTLCLL